MHTRTPFWQKITLIIFGLFITVIILETGLRIGGFILLSLQEYRNLESIRSKGVYRIMCLGESTTSGQYPVFLEMALNQRNLGIKFSVIDKGVPSIDTTVILRQLEYNLDKYHPDMVVAMMGVNDKGEHILREDVFVSRVMRFLKSFRTYKLARLLWLHISSQKFQSYLHGIGLNHAYAEEKNSISAEVLFKKALELDPKNDAAYAGLGWIYREQGRLSQAEDSLKKAIELNPQNDAAYSGLGWLYREQRKASQAEDSFKKAIGLNHANDIAYAGLGWLYREQGKLAQAEDSLKKAIELNPMNYDACMELGRLYRTQGKARQAEDSFKKAIEIYPKNDATYIELGRFYRAQGKLSQAEDSFRKAVELNPKNATAYSGLGWFYQKQGKYPQAEDSFKKAIELEPKNIDTYIEAGWFYRVQGKFAQAENSFKKAIELNPKNPNAYIELGRFYRIEGRYYQAENSFKKAIELNSESDRAYGALSVLYEEMGRPKLAKGYDKKANSLRVEYYNPVTVNNYRKLKEVLDKKAVKLVCVQYPMRSIEPLRGIFEGQDGVIFVDNEKIFKEAVEKSGHSDYFGDIFAGDFGHCTSKGNQLLGENIAGVIAKEVFRK